MSRTPSYEWIRYQTVVLFGVFTVICSDIPGMSQFAYQFFVDWFRGCAHEHNVSHMPTWQEICTELIRHRNGKLVIFRWYSHWILWWHPWQAWRPIPLGASRAQVSIFHDRWGAKWGWNLNLRFQWIQLVELEISSLQHVLSSGFPWCGIGWRMLKGRLAGAHLSLDGQMVSWWRSIKDQPKMF